MESHIIQFFMRTIRGLMDSGKLSEEEYDALGFAHDLAAEEFFAELQVEQEYLDKLKETGMMN